MWVCSKCESNNAYPKESQTIENNSRYPRERTFLQGEQGEIREITIVQMKDILFSTLFRIFL